MLSKIDQLFTQYYVNHYMMVHKTIYGIIHNFDDATELTQEVFFVLHKKMQEGYELQNPPAWLRHVAIRTANNHKKHQIFWSKCLTIIEQREMENIKHRQQMEKNAKEISIILNDTIEKHLTPSQKTMIYKRYNEKLPLNVISGEMKITSGSLRHQLEKSKNAIRRGLIKQGVRMTQAEIDHLVRNL